MRCYKFKSLQELNIWSKIKNCHGQGRRKLIFHDFGITESRVSDLVQLRSLVWRYWSVISRPEECSNVIMMWDNYDES